MTPTRLAALQMVSAPNVADNLATAERLLADAARQGASFAVLPEFFPIFGVGRRPILAAAEAFGDGPVQAWARRTARRFGLWLIAGGIPLASDTPERCTDTALAFDPDGNCVARYDKIHLFSFAEGEERYDEARTLVAGTTPTAFSTPFGRVALAICYDLRFPELFRAQEEIDLIALSAAFTETTGQAHWETLLAARAIENQCYLLAANQGGTHADGRRTYGNSMIIDPWGKILARADKGEGLVLADFDPERLKAVRRRLPALRHRKLGAGIR